MGYTCGEEVRGARTHNDRSLVMRDFSLCGVESLKINGTKMTGHPCTHVTFPKVSPHMHATSMKKDIIASKVSS
jgi:hypothetical protein